MGQKGALDPILVKSLYQVRRMAGWNGQLGGKGFQKLLVLQSSRGYCCLEFWEPGAVTLALLTLGGLAAERAGTSVWRRSWGAATQLTLVPYL